MKFTILSLSLIVVVLFIPMSVFAQSGMDIAICHQYNSDGSCKVGTSAMHLDEYYEAEHRLQTQNAIAGITVTVIIIGIIVAIIVGITKKLKNRKKIKAKNYEQQLKKEKKDWKEKQEREKEIKELKKKVENLENHSNVTEKGSQEKLEPKQTQVDVKETEPKQTQVDVKETEFKPSAKIVNDEFEEGKK